MISAQEAGAPSESGPQAEIYQAPRQDKPWGYERIFAVVEGRYAGKIIHVNAGQSLSLQYHEEKEETIFLLSGAAVIQYGPIGAELAELKFGPGDTIHIPAKIVHRVTAVTDVVFAETSTAQPGWRDDVVRLRDNYGRTGTSAP